MARYIVTYDLVGPTKNYSGLIERIKSYGTWAQISESSWAVVTNQSATQVVDYLKQPLDSNDKLLVGPLGKCAWINLPEVVVNWLNQT